MPNKGKLYESDFEEAFISLLKDTHWTYTFGENLSRKQTDPLIEEDLRSYLSARYHTKGLTANEVDGIVGNLRNVGGRNEYYALQNTFYLYRDGYDFHPQESEPFKLEYIDFDNPGRNIFRCVNQFTMVQGTENRRPDIMLYVNGIPVCIIELKNPTTENATVYDAHTQICTRYMRDIPSLLKYCAIAVVSDAAKTLLGTPFTPYEYFYEWKKVDNEDTAGRGLDTLRTLVRGALSPERLLEILRDYVYFPDPNNSEETTEVICRYPQFFATRKLRDHILNHLRSVGGDGKGGTYFGATGCGKTYTMLFLARQLALRCKSALGSPTIIPFKNFIRSIIVGKVRYASIETISSVEVCFYQKECWKCHRPSYQYWVSKLISDKGVIFRLAFSEEISPTDENIANGVTQYLRALPNSNIIMGEVKPRYSKTRRQSYRSFGCPYCDSLFGDYFAMDDQMEMMYEEDRLPHAIIKLPKSFTFAVNQWYAEN